MKIAVDFPTVSNTCEYPSRCFVLSACELLQLPFSIRCTDQGLIRLWFFPMVGSSIGPALLLCTGWMVHCWHQSDAATCPDHELQLWTFHVYHKQFHVIWFEVARTHETCHWSGWHSLRCSIKCTGERLWPILRRWPKGNEQCKINTSLKTFEKFQEKIHQNLTWTVSSVWRLTRIVCLGSSELSLFFDFFDLPDFWFDDEPFSVWFLGAFSPCCLT